MRQLLTMALLPLCLLAPLTGCGGAAEQKVVTVIQREKQDVPADLRTCAAEPVAPAAETQRTVARYVVDLADAGEDCRSKLNALNRILQ